GWRIIFQRISGVPQSLHRWLPRCLPHDRLRSVTWPRIASHPGSDIVCDDNLTFMRSLPAECCDLIYIDPPFDAPRPGDCSWTKATSKPRACVCTPTYLDFLNPRLMEMHRLLALHGTLYVHLDWRSVHYIKVLLDQVFGCDSFVNEIIWSYRAGSRPGKWF